MRLRAFIVTPLQDKFGIRNYLDHILKENNVFPPHGMWVDKTIVEASLQEIQRADFIIADVTSCDPDVMYLVGFAHGLRKPIMFIVQDQQPVPPSLRGDFLFVYDPSKPSQLGNQLKQHVEFWVNSYRIEVERRQKVG